ncbi:MAG: gamma-glutamylcyclotransferase family protein [Candidatus Binataceae bacterium]|jgi:gamma-glutamylcyclotransferase (GGCT)/AIG2-like uncharacterized protein YtfP
MLYFAYGSNMDWDQMRERCPSARFVCVAKLEDHQLIFPRKSKRRGCGVASVKPAKTRDVWGVVFQIEELEVGWLDCHEGYNPNVPPSHNSYVRKELRVFRDGREQHPLTVWTYVGRPQPGEHKPSNDYKNTILKGAWFWRLPDDYRCQLDAIEVSE